MDNQDFEFDNSLPLWHFKLILNRIVTSNPDRYSFILYIFASLHFAIFRQKNFGIASLRNLISSDIWSPVCVRLSLFEGF
jgi:hypothetical protein